MSEAWIGLVGALLGGIVAIAGSYLLLIHQRIEERKTFAAALFIEIKHIRIGLGYYKSTLEGARSAAFRLNAAVPLVELPSGLDAFQVFDATVDRIGLFEQKLAEEIVGFYHTMRILHDLWTQTDQAFNYFNKKLIPESKVIDNIKLFITTVDQVAIYAEKLERDLYRLTAGNSTYCSIPQPGSP